MISKDFDHKAMTSRKPSTRDAYYGLSSKHKQKSWKRSDNVAKAVDRLTKEEVDPTHKKILNKAKTSVPKAPKSNYERKVVSYLKKKYSEEVEQVDEASLTAGKRLISKHGEGSHTTRVYKDTEYNEYQVHHYKDGKHMGEGPVSYHDDKEDAENTAKMSLRKQMKEDAEQINEKLPASATAGDYVTDFKKSDAPQFQGKSKEKRRQMAIAAYLAAKRK